MSDILNASLREKLWHSMREDLAKFIPELSSNRLLMCCACGRFLPQDEFDLEHLIPQQAIKDDPAAVRSNSSTPANVRAGTMLLCKRRLLIKNHRMHNNGCNSWKGKYYDGEIKKLVAGTSVKTQGRISNRSLIAALNLAYLAAVAEFGYAIALMPSGALMRKQFFMPDQFHPQMPIRSQMVLAGGPIVDTDAPVWLKPFSFSFDNGTCYASMRNFVLMLPVTADPRTVMVTRIPFLPSKHTFRPDFRTVFT